MKRLCIAIFISCCIHSIDAQSRPKATISFNSNWEFFLGNDTANASWRKLNVPHDWSIELPFDKESPTGTGGGALRGGMGWYRKTFTVPASAKGKYVVIGFDGVYRNSEVWINGNYLGKRPNGYISFEYDLSPYLKYGNAQNVIVVKVDNSKQPNSRWYSGSGIYRNVWLTTRNKTGVAYTQVITRSVTNQTARIIVKAVVPGTDDKKQEFDAFTTVFDSNNKIVDERQSRASVIPGNIAMLHTTILINKPILWSVDNPYLYKIVTKFVADDGSVIDEYVTPLGIRYFQFDPYKGFSLNGKPLKINGVCNHHDLGCLGSAINKRALERQLQILKAMGCNAIRTSHNPPAPELLDLCDKMGFLVMDEAFDIWKVKKNEYDYHLDWDEWHERDLIDQVLRDMNHPSVFMWSIGNEVNEQWNKDAGGDKIVKALADIIRSIDTTRPIVTGNNNTNADNPLFKPGVMDIIGYNYAHNSFAAFHERFPGKKFIATETVSALQTRGHYDMPSDTIRRWPKRWDLPFEGGNPDTTCSAYDNCSTPWGSTHEETWKIMKKHDFLSGQFIWTGFDYLGEPTPYAWPARSSYFGIIDLAGFPKDVYYMYQSEWTKKNVLHVFPHWTWKDRDTVDVWTYYNNADMVELFLNGKSMGKRMKTGDDLHVSWRLKYVPGTITVVSMRNSEQIMRKEIKTAGAPARIILSADRKIIKADGYDLSFVTATVVDDKGVVVPDANNFIRFNITGEGSIAGMDNGCQTDLSSFKSNPHKAFNGLCLAVIQSNKKAGTIKLSVTADGLKGSEIIITTR